MISQEKHFQKEWFGTWGWLRSHEYPSMINEHCAYCPIILNSMLSIVHWVVCLYTTLKVMLLMHYSIVFACDTGKRLSKIEEKLSIIQRSKIYAPQLFMIKYKVNAFEPISSTWPKTNIFLKTLYQCDGLLLRWIWWRTPLLGAL